MSYFRTMSQETASTFGVIDQYPEVTLGKGTDETACASQAGSGIARMGDSVYIEPSSRPLLERNQLRFPSQTMRLREPKADRCTWTERLLALKPKAH